MFGLHVPLTKGFTSARHLQAHHFKHASALGGLNAMDYQARADLFLGAVKGPGAFECKRLRGDTVRYDPTTDEFGVLASDRTIRTYFIPIPCHTVSSVATRQQMRDNGACHGQPNNVAYFQSECGRH